VTLKTFLFQINAVFNVDINKGNVSLATNQHIRMISEGSCETEDWSNDAENTALISQEYITFEILL